MACFRDVFSTTAKVVLALFIISALIGVGSLVLGGLGSVVIPTSSTSEPGSGVISAGSTSSIETATHPEDDAADALRTTMPKSVWERGMARTVKHRCFTGGMSKEEVVRALGEPIEKSDFSDDIGSTWTWQLPPGECLKYDGDKCIERKKNSQRVFFTAKGNVRQQSECEAFNGDYIFNHDLFSSGAWR
jgi:hypothetical protein